MNPEAKFISIGFFTIYTISSSLCSSPENIFSLVNSLHNVWSALEEWHTDAKTHVKPIEPDSVEKKLVPLQEIYKPSETTPCVEPEELLDPEIRKLYQQSAEALCVAYAFSRVGREGKSAVLWPTLFGKKFCTLLNRRTQRALVLLYCYLLMLKDVSEGCWWLSEIGRCLEHVYESLNPGWRDWLCDVYKADEGDQAVMLIRCLVY
uniref:Uncharacterized protein n=1 Tax=Moniliophthora roreri TaxID=221103 RepID=A0A0W0G1G8_MONRR